MQSVNRLKEHPLCWIRNNLAWFSSAICFAIINFNLQIFTDCVDFSTFAWTIVISFWHLLSVHRCKLSGATWTNPPIIDWNMSRNDSKCADQTFGTYIWEVAFQHLFDVVFFFCRETTLKKVKLWWHLCIVKNIFWYFGGKKVPVFNKSIRNIFV